MVGVGEAMMRVTVRAVGVLYSVREEYCVVVRSELTAGHSRGRDEECGRVLRAPPLREEGNLAAKAVSELRTFQESARSQKAPKDNAEQ